MADGNIRVPEISELHDGREVDCVTIVRGGFTYYRQRVVTIDYAHQKTHEGRYFSGGHYDAAVVNGGVINLLIQMGAVSTFHAKFSATVSGDATIQLFEGTTVSAAGTAVTMTNHNRGSANSFSGTVTHTPTITADGNALNGLIYIPAGEKNQASGGGGGFHDEYILSMSTNYLVRVTNNSGAAAKVYVEVDGYMPDL